MFPGDSPAKRIARKTHWDLAATVPNRPRQVHIGFAGPQALDADEACVRHYPLQPLHLFERDLAAYQSALHVWKRARDLRDGADPPWSLHYADVRTELQSGAEIASAFLDFCGPLCPETTDVIKTIAPKMVSGGILTVIVLAGRETDTFERWLENKNRVAGTFGSRILALYELLPHPPKEWFAPVIAIGYVGHKVPMLQVSFRREKRPSSPARQARIIQVLHQL